MIEWLEGVALLAEHLRSTEEPRVQSPAQHTLGVMAPAHPASTWEEEEVKEVHGYLWLHRDFKASLGYMRPYLKNTWLRLHYMYI